MSSETKGQEQKHLDGGNARRGWSGDRMRKEKANRSRDQTHGQEDGGTAKGEERPRRTARSRRQDERRAEWRALYISRKEKKRPARDAPRQGRRQRQEKRCRQTGGEAQGRGTIEAPQDNAAHHGLCAQGFGGSQ